MIAIRAGTWDVLSGKAAISESEDDIQEWEKLDRDALTMIGLTVARSELGHIRECKTSNEMWRALAAAHAQSSRANRIALRQQLNRVALVENQVQEYANQIGDIAARLRAMGVEFKDPDEVDVLIMNLPNTWANVASSLMFRPGDLTVKEVVAVLLKEEFQRKYEETHAITGVRMGARAKKPGPARKCDDSKGAYIERRTCYRCRQAGHIATNCLEPQPVALDSSNIKSKDKSAGIAEIGRGSDDVLRIYNL
ncbi:Retrovirus-related Pol polyprotein from transposon TNT 1-94 Includes: RecName: Full=Protease [Rhizoctonia solani AG-1 IB]|uniref:Rhizoctonia solani AG1-IB WGS project CAOJ00000000 data, isolate 7/3/14, contig 23844 n=1 Tax=Thanatephorus cucumeris (strain AG1-IB / isolate 7/3/14) TaxID=1108050 RepID=M5CC03_THACB|nr:Retrovirus-related Pol polyprotein from transposon TNT 1-94 Includes: RecName: Full=Protease [Rhizoctonia solani AG-1 IB]